MHGLRADYESLSREGAGYQKRGWKETRSNLKEKDGRPNNSLVLRVEQYRVVFLLSSFSQRETRCGEGTS